MLSSNLTDPHEIIMSLTSFHVNLAHEKRRAHNEDLHLQSTAHYETEHETLTNQAHPKQPKTDLTDRQHLQKKSRLTISAAISPKNPPRTLRGSNTTHQIPRSYDHSSQIATKLWELESQPHKRNATAHHSKHDPAPVSLFS
jgi:hypothetical protein